MTQLRGFLSMRLPLSGIAAFLALSHPLAPAARAADASPWVRGAQSGARLIDGGREAGGAGLMAGLEISLAPHFITYWRDPGDAGVPPTFSFTGSTNVRVATVRYPAPRRLDEAGASAFGYEGDVTFPILIEAVDASKPVGLAVALDYAVCHEICLPAHADLHLALHGGASTEAGHVREALAAVPRPASLAAAGAPPSIRAVEPDGSGGFSVTAALGGGSVPGGSTLFVEAPEGWAYEAGAAIPAGTPSGDDGRVTFPVKRLDPPKDVDRPPGPVVLTLVTPSGAIEVAVKLDAAPAKP